MLEEIKKLKIGHSLDWKPFLSTYNLEKINKNEYVINYTGDGWLQATVNLKQIKQIINGELNLLSLNWV